MERILISVWILISAFSSYAQVTFQNSYHKPGYFGTFTSIATTPDNGYCLGGYLCPLPPAAEQFDANLTRLDSTGSILWSYTYSDTLRHEAITCIAPAADGGFLLGGWESDPMPNPMIIESQFFAAKTDSAGTLLWRKDYSEFNVSWTLGECSDTNDGGLIFAGYTNAYSPGYHPSCILLRTDSAGQLLWAKLFDNNLYTAAGSVKQTNDNGFILAGTCDTSLWGGGSVPLMLIKTDSSGNLQWSKYYGSFSYNPTISIKQEPGGGYIVASTSFNPSTNYDLTLIRTDSAGNVLWSKIIGTPWTDSYYFVQISADNCYLIAGVTSDSPFGPDYPFLMKLDTSGTSLWYQAYKETSPAGLFTLSTSYDGYVLAGNHIIPTTQRPEPWIVKTSSDGSSSCNDSIITLMVTDTLIFGTSMQLTETTTTGYDSIAFVTKSGLLVNATCITTSMEHFSSGSDAIMVYPNPFEEELVLKGTKQDGIITVYDLSGKLTGQYPASEDQTLIQTVVIKPGFYMLNYTDKKNSINYKVTKF